MSEVIFHVWRRMDWLMITGFALAYFIYLAAPGLTWINTDSDSSIYIAAALHFLPTHPTGAPAFNLINMGIVRALPLVSPAHALAIGSAVASGITAGMIYGKTRSVIATMVFLAAGLVVSQSTIIESYALVTMCMVGMYLWRDRPLAVVGFGLIGLGTHHLIGLTLLPVLFTHWQNKTLSRAHLLLLLAPLWYLYLPLSLKPDFIDIWLRGNGWMDYLEYFGSQGGLTLGLAIVSQDALTRLADFVPIVLSGFAAALLPIAARFRNDLLTWCMVLPFIHYGFGLPHVAFVYAMPGFAFGGIMAAQGIPRIQEWLKEYDARKYVPWLVAAPAALMIAVNLWVFDIGRSLDPEMTATAFYNDLYELPDDAVIWTYHRGWELVTVRLFNQDNDTRIDYILRAHNDIAQARDAIREAYHDGRLYHTQLANPQDYATRIEKTDPTAIWINVLKQWYRVPGDEPATINPQFLEEWYLKNDIPPEAWAYDWESDSL